MDMYRDVNEMFAWGCLDDGVCFDFGGEEWRGRVWGVGERRGGKQKY